MTHNYEKIRKIYNNEKKSIIYDYWYRYTEIYMYKAIEEYYVFLSSMYL